MNDPVRHIIVLMFENHSFDQMLGCFKSEAGFNGMEGVDPNAPGVNRDSEGNEYRQMPSTDAVVAPDPRHELEHVRVQLRNGNSGFVLDYEQSYRTTPEQRQRIMSYYPLDFLPALHALAKHFTICDHWYSSVPGPTWANRFFVHSGTSLGRVTMPAGWDQTPSLYLGYDQDTIYDRLSEAGVSWKVYHGDVPQSLCSATSEPTKMLRITNGWISFSWT